MRSFLDPDQGETDSAHSKDSQGRALVGGPGDTRHRFRKEEIERRRAADEVDANG